MKYTNPYEKQIASNNFVAYNILKNSINNNSLSHAYIFKAKENYEILNEPLFLINEIIHMENKDIQIENIYNYADLHILDGQDQIIKKNDLLDKIEILKQTALEKFGKKILWIKNIENSNVQTINSLLKFLEEPTSNTFIIMTTNNFSKVLSTIKSRSQIISLNSLTIDNFMKELNFIDFKYRRLIANISNSFNDAKELWEKNDIPTLLFQIETLFSKFLLDKNLIFTEIPKIIDKNNYNFILLIFREFLNDIWRINFDLPTSFKNESLIKKYYNSFNYSKTLFSINDFLSKIKYHTNFDLMLNNLLIDLGDSYV